MECFGVTSTVRPSPPFTTRTRRSMCWCTPSGRDCGNRCDGARNAYADVLRAFPEPRVRRRFKA
jgi:hypothetical protein